MKRFGGRKTDARSMEGKEAKERHGKREQDVTVSSRKKEKKKSKVCVSVSSGVPGAGPWQRAATGPWSRVVRPRESSGYM